MSAKPNVPYKWDDNAEFKITGQEFGLFRSLVNAVLRGEEVPRVVFALEGDKTIKRLFNEGVEDGRIYEDVSRQIIQPQSGLIGA